MSKKLPLKLQNKNYIIECVGADFVQQTYILEIIKETQYPLYYNPFDNDVGLVDNH